MEALETLLAAIKDGPTWWMYGIVALIPLCVVLALRELICWFFKINRLVSTLERLNLLIAEQQESKASEQVKTVITDVVPAKKEEEFTLG